MRRVSSKRAAEHRKRIALLKAMDADQMICERCHAHRAEECHEPLTRARGGSITDPANWKFLCHACHSEITREPLLAHDEGLMLHSWEVRS